MLKKILLIGLLACLLLSAWSRLVAQDKGVSRAWGKVLGKAQTDRDFLIYDATCSQNQNPAIFIVGKAENSSMEMKRNGIAYYHAQDEHTDAFLACMSLEGELLWNTYLPALRSDYYNAFATTVEHTQDNTILVIGNAYHIKDDIASTKNQIPQGLGELFVFEFDTYGQLIQSQSYMLQLILGNSALSLSVPRIVKSVLAPQISPMIGRNRTFTGIAICNLTESPYDSEYSIFNYSYAFTADRPTNDNILKISFSSTTDPQTVYSASYPLTPYEFNYISLTQSSHHQPSLTGGLGTLYGEIGGHKADIKNAPKANEIDLYSRGIDFVEHSPIFEQWNITTEQLNHTDDEQHEENFRFYGYPTGTHVENTLVNGEPHKLIFPGTVQNIHTYKGKYIVQGIHCQNYSNGFFKTIEGENYAYSHDKNHLIPISGRGFYQNRNNSFTAVPYLLVYDSSLFETPPIPLPEMTDDNIQEPLYNFDFEAPLWGSYLDADWLYEDIFHVTDSAQWKDIYQPYEPVLCSYGNTFFFIGNAQSINPDLIDNPTMTEELFHHQGVVIAFLAPSFNGDCPPQSTAFQNLRFLCPDDSVELKLSPDYAGFKFRFESDHLANGSIVLNADSSRAWAKKEGIFAPFLDGSFLGCPDITVDTVRISLSPYPEPVSALDPDSTIVACAAVGVVLNPVTEPDSSFSYHWFDGDESCPKTVRFNNDSLFFASVKVNGYCTSFSDSTQIRLLPPYVNLGKDTGLCIDTSQIFADTTVLLRLNARQNYFPDADWGFRWKINGVDASDNDSLLLLYDDLLEYGNLKRAVITVEVSLSDINANSCTAYDTLVFSLLYRAYLEHNRFLPQSEILCAHKDLNLLMPETANEYRAFWLDQDSVLLPYGYDTNQFTVTGMRGTDGFGANTDTRSPRFFQLRLDHKLCSVSFFDTLLVYDQVKPAFELPVHDTVICLNEPIELDSLNPLVYRPFYSFEWNDGTKGSGYTFTDTGLYILKFFVNEDFAVCGYDTAVDTVRVLWADPALTLISLSDTSFCEKLSVTLDATVPYPSTRYSWQEGNLDDLFSPLDDSTLFTPPVLEVDKEVSLALFVVDTMGCVNTRQIAVTEDDCKPGLSIPNVFTPNGDGVNDVLKFKKIDNCFDVDILIVDRKGSHVLHQKVKDPEEFSWNGCMNNGSRKLPDGAYFYFISYKNAYGKKKYQSGSITILGSKE